MRQNVKMPTPLPRIQPEDYRMLLRLYLPLLDLKVVRRVLHLMRSTPEKSPNLIIPSLGLTLGEFAVLYLMRPSLKPKTKP